MVRTRFAVLDANSDGGIDKDEAHAAAVAAAAALQASPGRRMVSDIPGSGPDESWFDKSDADRDGRVTLAELSVEPLANFDRIDSNKDGILSVEERAADPQVRTGPRRQ
ncbi:MAG TPA: hypothetical protein VIL42_09200 [Sphingomicrobium sp.]